MKITACHSMIKSILRNTSFFYILHYHGVCSNNYFEYGTFYKSFILRFCWNLLALAIIFTVNKDLDK